MSLRSSPYDTSRTVLRHGREYQNKDRYDFDKALLPDDNWIRDNDEYEVEKVACLRSGKRRILREFTMLWEVYKKPTWVKPIIIAEACHMTIYEIERIGIDSR
ncbi:Hypothetical protein PHPALM_5996 [Phytophthora palmivora]|uniref:Chromo domain-containing protein n=1 Tax=Phytophthora palmivora TaxID=4796 RepID=A0A2P4YGA3_9STRA|nr:Hypothetical protein PHPALM_5996 [Phytophthora palmivora]